MSFELPRREQMGGLLEARAPGAWIALALLASLVGGAVTVAIVCEVTLTARGPGKLRSLEGLAPVILEVGGTVTELYVSPGACVPARAPILRVDSAKIRAQLFEAERNLTAATAQLAHIERRRASLVRRRLGLLEERRNLLVQRADSQEETAQAARVELDNSTRLVASGMLAERDQAATQEQLRASVRDEQRVRQELSDTGIQMRELEARHDEELWRARDQVTRETTARDSLRLATEQTVARAPQAGCVDALLARLGDVIEAGRAVARVVPPERPQTLVAFLPERERAFVQVGQLVRVAVEQLPVEEFGTLRGRVERIALELATRAEVAEGLGERFDLTAPSYQVTIRLEPAPQIERPFGHLRAGMLVEVRFPLRRQRLIALVLAPMRRWLT